MRNQARQLAVVLILLAAVAACTSPAARPAAPAKPAAVPSQAPPLAQPPISHRPARPNILLLLTDDQAASDMGVMTRTAQRLGASGTEFTRAFSAYPLCCPARASILTGQLAHNHHVMGNELPWGGVTKLDESQTLPVWLQRAGYRTATIGKYLNGYPGTRGATYVPPGWDDWQVPVADIYDYYKYTLNENGELRSYSGTYETDFVRDRATSMVKDLAAQRKPFFLWVNFLAPHVGLPVEPDDPRAYGEKAIDTPAVDSRHRDAMADKRVPRTPALDERDVSDKAKFIRNLGMKPVDQLDEAHQQRLEALLSVDEAVAQILDELKRSGEYDNTLIVFGSDNGYALGQHRWVSKILGYEESTRIPLFMAGPGVAPGVRRDQLVSLADLAPTFLALSGAAPSLAQDGVSLLPLSQDPSAAAGRALLIEAGGWPYPKQERLYTGVRTADDRVLLRWFNGFEEVYDLATDPYQLDGRVSPAERAGVPELRDALRRLRNCRGAACSSVELPRR